MHLVRAVLTDLVPGEPLGPSKALFVCSANSARSQLPIQWPTAPKPPLTERDAADGELKGILGYEDRPLVSADYTNDTRSGIVDGPSTMVVDTKMVKVLIWYDNEIGYVWRISELASLIASSLEAR